jgi:1-deoxy-D-xylulose-5-phosphate reductoisomerase
MKLIAVLGSTGSIGSATLGVVEAYPEHFKIVALAAGRNLDAVRRQVSRHAPAVVSLSRAEDARALSAEFSATRFVSGPEGLQEVACGPECEMVVVAVVGTLGLAPTVAAIRAGKDVALANKETLVAAGELVMAEVRSAGIILLPVDSEHCAIHQILHARPVTDVARIVLTASGGPFRSWPPPDIASATVEQALAHPSWRMGPKITVDSATMMNKGLEIIEAQHLFGLAEAHIDVIVHPQSLVHSMVELVDGSLIAQLSGNDMRHPILYALSWPDRLPSRLPRLDLAGSPPLVFEAPDSERFPALTLARSAARSGGEMPTVLNAANEVAVHAFLEGRCRLPTITATVEDTLTQWAPRNRALESIEHALAVDFESRELAARMIRKYGGAAVGSEYRC